jgi:hypothetical protein
VAAIAASLANSLPAEDDPTGAPLARHAALESGRAGLALFYAYLARSTGDRAALDQAEALLARALDAAPRAEVGRSLCAGITGIDWVAAHLQRLGITPGGRAEVFGHAANARLTAEVERADVSDGPEECDLLYGQVGLGVSALEWLPSPPVVTLLERVVEQLAAQAELRPDGIAWWTAPEHAGAGVIASNRRE